MKLPHAPTLTRFFHFSIFIGPLAFLSGIIIAIYGDLHSQANTTLTGLIFIASGLIIWGCHGLRRRGKRPGFMLMATLGTSFFLLHLYYRYSDYRWVKINNISFDPATLTHLESRVELFISILLLSVLIGILPPLPAGNRSRKVSAATINPPDGFAARPLSDHSRLPAFRRDGVIDKQDRRSA